MTVRFSGAIVARIISPDTTPRFAYTAGEAISKGDQVSKGESDGHVYQAQASDATRMPSVGCALNTAVSGGTVYITNAGIIRAASRTEDFGQDDQIYVSATRGKATKNVPASVGNFVQFVGRSIGAADIMLDVEIAMYKLEQV